MKDYSESDQTMITIVRAVRNDSYQMEIVDKVQKPSQNVLQLLNKTDERFNLGNNRFAWVKVMPHEAQKYFGIDPEELAKLTFTEGRQREDMVEGKDYLTVEKANPTLNGQALRIQISETTEPTEWQEANLEQAAKQIEITAEIAANPNLIKSDSIAEYIGEVGYFLTEEGQPVFANATVITGEPSHKFLESGLFPKAEIEVSTSGIALREPDKVKAKSEAVKA